MSCGLFEKCNEKEIKKRMCVSVCLGVLFQLYVVLLRKKEYKMK